MPKKIKKAIRDIALVISDFFRLSDDYGSSRVQEASFKCKSHGESTYVMIQAFSVFLNKGSSIVM